MEEQRDSDQPRRGAILASLWLLVFIGASVAGLLGWQQFSTPQWRYAVISPSDTQLLDELNKWGAEGWEVVSARRATSSITNDASYEMIVRRRER